MRALTPVQRGPCAVLSFPLFAFASDERLSSAEALEDLLPNSPQSQKRRFVRCLTGCRMLALQPPGRPHVLAATLFPDLDGAAQYINALWELNFDTALGHLPASIQEQG